jgi:hypothetical protein
VQIDALENVQGLIAGAVVFMDVVQLDHGRDCLMSTAFSSGNSLTDPVAAWCLDGPDSLSVAVCRRFRGCPALSTLACAVGETRGFQSGILRHPERKLTVIVPYSIALAIAQILLPGARP